MSVSELRRRSIRTLAWLGDAEFEREVRMRIAERGDYRTDRLNTIKARIVRAEAQARLLDAILDQLDDEERDLVRRAKNTSVPPSARSQRNQRAYRAATALEALVATWQLAADSERFEQILAPRLEQAIDEAVAGTRKPRRG